MKKYSKDALELLSSAELCDIKAGENSSGCELSLCKN